MGGFGVAPHEITLSSDQIHKIVSEVKQGQLGHVGGGGADVFGHAGVASALSDFCSAVESATEIMVKTAQAAGDNLRATAQSYAQLDDQAQQGLGTIASAVKGLHGGAQ